MCDFRNKLCKSNIELLAEIEEILPVRFELWNKQSWGAKIKNVENIGVVYHPSEFLDAKAAHELLHLKIAITIGDNRSLYMEAQKFPYISHLFDYDIVQHLLNSYEHMKIITEYRSMGFDDADFFEDIEQSIQQVSFMTKIQREGLGKKSYDINLLRQYIASCISYLSYPLANNWSRERKILKRADKSIFDAIDNYLKEIVCFPLNDEGKEQMEQSHINFINNIVLCISNKTLSNNGVTLPKIY